MSNALAAAFGLVFEPVEFVAGERWLICHWQPCVAYQIGHPEPRNAEPQLRDDIEKEVAKRLLDQGGEKSGDLGVFFLYELALHYSKARRALWTWLNAWERNSMAFNQGAIQANSLKP